MDFSWGPGGLPVLAGPLVVEMWFCCLVAEEAIFVASTLSWLLLAERVLPTDLVDAG